MLYSFVLTMIGTPQLTFCDASCRDNNSTECLPVTFKKFGETWTLVEHLGPYEEPWLVLGSL